VAVQAVVWVQPDLGESASVVVPVRNARLLGFGAGVRNGELRRGAAWMLDQCGPGIGNGFGPGWIGEVLLQLSDAFLVRVARRMTLRGEGVKAVGDGVHEWGHEKASAR
jgi:hypothetical protein